VAYVTGQATEFEKRRNMAVGASGSRGLPTAQNWST